MHRNKLASFEVIRIGIVCLALVMTKPVLASDLLVFAPSSMTEVLNRVLEQYQQATGNGVKVSVAGTGQLARQIEAGAPANIFISADRTWIDYLQQRKLLIGEPHDLATTRLVVAVRRETENWVDVKTLLTQSRFAMADPATVPAGRYARQALDKLGWWEEARSRAIYGENVRVTLRRLALGEVEAAIVYASDLEVEPNARAALVFAGGAHEPIIYVAAQVSPAAPGSAQFLEYLTGPKALGILERFGFNPVPERLPAQN